MLVVGHLANGRLFQPDPCEGIFFSIAALAGEVLAGGDMDMGLTLLL